MTAHSAHADHPPTGTPAIVLLSGGLDSAVALAAAIRAGHTCHTLSFRYGQRHGGAELTSADAVAASMHIPPERRHVLDVNLSIFGGSALTTSTIAVPKRDKDTPAPAGIPPTYVPARNLVFLSCAAALAEAVGARDVCIGVNAVDYSGYPDCREPFIRAFETAVNLGTKAGAEDHRPLRVHTPLIHLTKAQIIQMGTRLGVNFSLTHSCYDPVRIDGHFVACGLCDSCHIRAQGFIDAGVPDPTRYDGEFNQRWQMFGDRGLHSP